MMNEQAKRGNALSYDNTGIGMGMYCCYCRLIFLFLRVGCVIIRKRVTMWSGAQACSGTLFAYPPARNEGQWWQAFSWFLSFGIRESLG